MSPSECIVLLERLFQLAETRLEQGQRPESLLPLLRLATELLELEDE
ncbi:hypothetical protein [Deinococcus aetherius]|nr:hypothetical protein [Deinococcus aetherius]